MTRPLRKTPRCATCDASLTTAKLFIDGRWTCSDCAYELEYGPVERKPRNRVAKGVPQDDNLFPLPAPVARARRAQSLE